MDIDSLCGSSSMSRYNSMVTQELPPETDRTAAPHEDVYLSSLRQNSRLFESPPPRSAARGKPGGAAAEEYASPLLARSHARTLERQRLLRELPSPRRQRRPTRDAAEARRDETAIRTTRRTQKLWDLESPVSDDKENAGAPQSPFSYDLDYDHTTTLVQRKGPAPAATDGGVWDAAQVRREARRGIAKADRADVGELERCARDMKRRIARYGPSGEGATGGNAASGKAAVADDPGGDRRDDYESTSVASRSSRAAGGARTRGAEERAATGRTVGKHEQRATALSRLDRSDDYESKVIEPRTLKLGGGAAPQGAEERATTRGVLDNGDVSEYGKRGQGSRTPSRERARKSASSRGTEGDEAASTPRARDRSEEYVSTSDRGGGPAAGRGEALRADASPTREERLLWIRERNRQLDGERAPPPPAARATPPSSPAVAASREGKLESWWAQRKQEQGTLAYGRSPARAAPFKELEEEPTIDEAKGPGAGATARGEGAPAAGDGAAPGTPPKAPRTRRSTSFASTGHEEPSPAKPGRGPLPPRPEDHATPRSEARSARRRDGGAWTPSTPSSLVGRSVAHPAGPIGASTSDSVLSDDVDSRGSGVRCRSVASSTLAVLLTRLEGAEAAFSRALANGDVAEQAALAGLMARLGEAAVTMRRLERVPDSP